MNEGIRQRRKGDEFKDIYSVPRLRQQPTDSKRKSIFVAEWSLHKLCPLQVFVWRRLHLI
jgi:hypothetical protein